MSKIQNLNAELERLNRRLSQIEACYDDVDLNRVLELKQHVLDRATGKKILSNRFRGRSRHKKDIEDFFSRLSPSNLVRLKSKSFGNVLIFGNDYIRAQLERRRFDTNQSIEPFFLTKEKIHKDEIKKRKLMKDLETIHQNGYGGFFSSRPSKAEYEKKVMYLERGIKELTHNVPQSYIHNEEFLLSLCKISHTFHNEVREIDAKISSIKKELNDLKKQEALSLKMAKAAAFDDEARQQARSIKSKITTQEFCPYCSRKVTETLHLDHIHPLSKGGLNVTENLVYCCANCNLKKSDKGVFQFCKEQGFDYEKVCNRLLMMGKHV